MPAGGLRFRNLCGVVHPSLPPRPAPGSTDALLADNKRRGHRIGPRTNRHGRGDPLHLALVVDAIADTAAAA